MTRLDDDDDAAERGERMPLTPADEERILERALGLLRGRMKGWVALMGGLTAAWVAVGAWAALSFFRVETNRSLILYATVFLLSAVAVSLLKIWYWMEMNRYAHTREIKRLELQVARILETLGKRSTAQKGG